MNNEFNFMSFEKNPYKSEGVFHKNGSEIDIIFDNAVYTGRFKSFMREKQQIGDVAFYNEGLIASYDGPFMVIKVSGSAVTLKKV